MTEQDRSDSRYKVPDSVLTQEVGDEAVLLELEQGTYFSLNAVGAQIWSSLQQGLSRSQLVDALLEEYDVSREQAAEDVQRLLEEAERHGLLVAQ